MGVSSTECPIRQLSSCSKPAHHQHQHHLSHCCANATTNVLQGRFSHQNHQQHQVGITQHDQHRCHHHNQGSKQSHHDAIVTPRQQSCGNDTNILAPLKNKMKVLKTLKKKMGLASRSPNADTNNLPPLTFHPVHGSNIRLSNGSTIATRYKSYCKGITFSARPVRIGEKVCVKFLELSDDWGGVIRFGFTSNDPINLRNGLPRYACPDLNHKPGYWAKALAECFAKRDSVLFYYLTSAGDVYFGIDGEEVGVFFKGVETRNPLWAIIDVYGSSTTIEFVDPNRQHFNNVLRRPQQSNEDNAQHNRHSAMGDANNAVRDVERIIVPSMQTVKINHEDNVELPGLRFQPTGVLFTPLPFHQTSGRNIRFSNQQCVATRNDPEFCHGYAFASRPLVLGELLVIQILATKSMYIGALALGFTSCDPNHLTVEDLPDDSDLLLDRPEYWVVSKDVASSLQPGDEIAFTVTQLGEVQMSKNGGVTTVIMHVDQSLQLWTFVDVYGSTQCVRMLASCSSNSPPRQRILQESSSNSISNASATAAPVPTQQPITINDSATAELSRFTEFVQFKPAIGGGTVLVVNLPPQNSYPHPSTFTPQPFYTPSSQKNSTFPPTLTDTVVSTGSSTSVDPATHQSHKSNTTLASSSLQQWTEGLQPTPGQPSECSICYERSIDSALYMCGHMCMCYTCALQQWRGKGGGHCPLCRAAIRDVIRIYRS